MAEFQVTGVRIAGVSSCVPETTRDLSEIAERFGSEEADKIAASIGVETRRVAAATTCASDLCYAAAERLLQELGWDREAIDGLVFVTQSPDYFAPATACVLHKRLGLGPACAAFDMNLGCSGYVYGLGVGAQLARGKRSDGTAKRVLLLVGDTITKMLSPDDRSTLPLFGDAGSATALEACDDAPPMSFCLGTDGGGYEQLIVREGAFRGQSCGTAAPESRGRFIQMDGAEVFKFALSEVPGLYRRTVASAGWEPDDVDSVVMHQSNEFMLEHFRKRLKLPSDRFVIGLRDYGNASCTSIPLAMTHAWGGGRISKRLVLVGFGVGWSWGGVALTCDGTLAPELVVYPESSVASHAA